MNKKLMDIKIGQDMILTVKPIEVKLVMMVDVFLLLETTLNTLLTTKSIGCIGGILCGTSQVVKMIFKGTVMNSVETGFPDSLQLTMLDYEHKVNMHFIIRKPTLVMRSFIT